MEKNIKIGIGVALIGVGAYLLWKKQDSEKQKVAYVGNPMRKRKTQKSFGGSKKKNITSIPNYVPSNWYKDFANVPPTAPKQFFQRRSTDWMGS